MGEPGFRQVCRECAGCAMPCKQLEPVEVAFCRLRRDAGDGVRQGRMSPIRMDGHQGRDPMEIGRIWEPDNWS